MFNYHRILAFICTLVLCFSSINAKISDKRLCADLKCEVLISQGITTISYPSPGPHILSFSRNVDVKIYSKSAGSNLELWGVEINGKRGYAPRRFIRETKVLYPNPKVLVATEAGNAVDPENSTISINQSEAHEHKPSPDPAAVPYEVFEGTTLYNDAISPSTPENKVTPTELPNLQEPTPALNNPPDVDSSKQPEEHASEAKEILKDNKDESLFGSNILSDISSWINKEDDDEDDGEVEVEDEHEESDKHDLPVEPTIPSTADKVDEPTVATSSADNNEPTNENVVQEKANENDTDDRKYEEEPVKTGISNDPMLEQNEHNDEATTKSPESFENEISNADSVDNNIETVPDGNVRDVNENETLEHSDNSTKQEINMNDKGVQDDSAEKYKIIEESFETAGADLNNKNENSPKLTTFNADEQQFSNKEEFTTIVPSFAEMPESDNWTVENVTPDPGKFEEANSLDQESNIPESQTNGYAAEEVAENAITKGEENAVDENKVEEKAQDSGEIKAPDNMPDEETVKESVKEVSEEEGIQTVGTDEELETKEIEKEELKKVGEDVSKERSETENVPLIPEKVKEEGYSRDDEEYLKNLEKEATRSVEESNGDSQGLFSSVYAYLFNSAKKDEALEDQTEDNLDTVTDLEQNEMANDNTDPLVPEEIEGKSSIFVEELFTPKRENVLIVTAVTVLLFLLGYMIIDQNRKEGPLIAKINKVEKELLISMKENEMLKNRIETGTCIEENQTFSEEHVQNLETELLNAKNAQAALEEQVQALEKELENSTEVGLELNRMLTDILSSQNASDAVIANIEQLQKQLIEQQSVINALNESVTAKSTENHELMLELDIGNKKVVDLQAELDKMVLNLLKMEEEKDQQVQTLEAELMELKNKMKKHDAEMKEQVGKLNGELLSANNKLAEVGRELEIKKSEFALLKESAGSLKKMGGNSEALKSLLDVNSIKAELQQLKNDNQVLGDHLRREREAKSAYEEQVETAMREIQSLKAQNYEIDRQKVEALTKLEVLSAYFKTKEAELQKELAKQENLWTERQGEATSTIERIRFMQEELQNSKAQNELLKQEIVSQEVELKSQITVLEKKAHESWLNARQAERRLEDARQEAAQLRNRLTLRERSLNEDKLQNRVQSPLEHNGDLTASSPLHMNSENPSSPPPLLFGGQNHLTTSPPMPGLPPFLPPPPGVPFMPPPPLPGVPPFMPPHLPHHFPSDHRPAPLGRLSSPPLNSRYSPDSSRAYSPYDRNNSPSPPYDSEYSPSSPNSIPRMYSPYNSRMDERKEYVRPPPLRKARNAKVSGGLSSGSGNSNESLEKINKHSSKV